MYTLQHWRNKRNYYSHCNAFAHICKNISIATQFIRMKENQNWNSFGITFKSHKRNVDNNNGTAKMEKEWICNKALLLPHHFPWFMWYISWGWGWYNVYFCYISCDFLFLFFFLFSHEICACSSEAKKLKKERKRKSHEKLCLYIDVYKVYEYIDFWLRLNQ